MIKFFQIKRSLNFFSSSEASLEPIISIKVSRFPSHCFSCEGVGDKILPLHGTRKVFSPPLSLAVWIGEELLIEGSLGLPGTIKV